MDCHDAWRAAASEASTRATQRRVIKGTIIATSSSVAFCNIDSQARAFDRAAATMMPDVLGGA